MAMFIPLWRPHHKIVPNFRFGEAVTSGSGKSLQAPETSAKEAKNIPQQEFSQ
jgi:hypothetical protein